MALTTKLTPSEAANASQALQFLDSLLVYEKTAPATTDILGAKVVREPSALIEVVVRIATTGTAGGPTLIDVKKNGTTVLAAAVSIAQDDADGTQKVVLPATDALAKLEVNDVLTIETGATVSTNVADIIVEARVAKRFDGIATEKPLLTPNI